MSGVDRAARPQPPVSRDTAGFWEGIRAGEFRLQRCDTCGHLQYPPESTCQRCHGLDLQYQASSGRGHLVSYAIVHHPPAAGFEYPLPVGVVELEEGPRIVIGLDDDIASELVIDSRVVLRWPIADAGAPLASLVPLAGLEVPAGMGVSSGAADSERSSGDASGTPIGASGAPTPGGASSAPRSQHPRIPASGIVGIGFTEFSSNSGRSEFRLAVEACRAALADAGIDGSAVDGMVSFTMDTNPENDLARALGVSSLGYFARVGYGGGGACGALSFADRAIASGAASTVLIYRAFNERSGRRFGAGVADRPVEPTAEQIQFAWTSPTGLLTPASWMAVLAREMMHRRGLTSEDFGRVSVVARAHAASNPRAQFFGRPVTLDEHQSSRMIVDPLRLLDCCLETDGGVALVVTGLDRARDLPTAPVAITAAVQGLAPRFHMSRAVLNPESWRAYDTELCAAQLWELTGLRPSDIDAAMLYDAFTPQVLAQLESFGFCAPGDAGGFVRDGHIGLTGSLPVNTHGGQLGEAYLHGMNSIVEATMQLRGVAANQLQAPQHILVSSSPYVPSSAAILSAFGPTGSTNRAEAAHSPDRAEAAH